MTIAARTGAALAVASLCWSGVNAHTQAPTCRIFSAEEVPYCVGRGGRHHHSIVPFRHSRDLAYLHHAEPARRHRIRSDLYRQVRLGRGLRR
jgi:hypothetical protein